MTKRLPAGVWWADTPHDEWTDDGETLSEIRSVWNAKSGDRRQEIVFIGIDLDESAIKTDLEKCLVTEMEAGMTEDDWRKINHPFAVWDGEIEYLAEAAHVH